MKNVVQLKSTTFLTGENMKKQETFGSLILLVTSIIWGCAFVAQKVGMDHIGPFTFCGTRFIFSAVFLLIVVITRDLMVYKKIQIFYLDKKDLKVLLTGGILCGITLAIATMLQQYSMQGTTAGKAGFITALYIVLVPIFGIAIKKKVKFIEWISVGVALISLMLLCFKKEELTNNLFITGYDIGLLACAICFSIQILLIDNFSKKADCIWLATIEFLTTAVIGVIAMFIFEKPNIESINKAIIPILYAGIASGGIAYTLQFIGQKHVKPVIASLIMSLESVISLIAGAILIHEQLSSQELLGCLFMFIAILMPQLVFKKDKKTE